MKGEVVVVNYPFTDHANAKKRPAFSIRKHGEDYTLLPITKQAHHDMRYTHKITNASFSNGYLAFDSYVRCDTIFTLHESLVDRAIGQIKQIDVDAVIEKVVDFIKN
ncbi:MAG: type II toxin-antitoxin system PemK/MazF family toxin [Spirochaetota bacterium]